MTKAKTTSTPGWNHKLGHQSIRRFVSDMFICNPSFRGLSPDSFEITLRAWSKEDPSKAIPPKAWLATWKGKM